MGRHNTSGICTSNPECADANRLAALARDKAARRRRLETDPEYRDKVNGYKRTPAALERRRERSRERYAGDAEFRERRRQIARDRYAQADPDYRARVRAGSSR